MTRVAAFTLSFLAVFSTATAGVLVLHMYAMHNGASWGYLLGVPALMSLNPNVAQASPARRPDVRQFPLVMKMLGEEENEHHRWLPSTIVANVGDTVILRVTNADPDAAHGFAIAAYDVFVRSISPGQTVTVQFRADRPGIFLFSCALPGCAADHGDQTGQLVVLGER